jgi:hypothetical protein
MSDTDPHHRGLSKNGHDQLQDHAIRDLHDEFSAHIKDEEDHHTENAEAHAEIFNFLRDAKNDDKWKRRIFGGGWSLLVLAVGALAGWLSSNETRLDALDKHIHEVQAEERGNAREGFQLAKDLRNDIDNNEDSIRELQRLHRIKPGKD